jgi:hypothetical protein
MQRSFPGGSEEVLRDNDVVSKNDFGKSKTCVTKCSTGGTVIPMDQFDLELGETKATGQSEGIMVKTETMVLEEHGLRK